MSLCAKVIYVIEVRTEHRHESHAINETYFPK